jgi:NACalpha-BTF3-like transcription factor
MGVRDVVRIGVIRESIARNFAMPDPRLHIWRSCCPSVTDAACEQLVEAETEAATNLIKAAKLDSAKKRAVVDGIRHAGARAQEALDAAEKHEASLLAQERVDAIATVERQRKQDEERIDTNKVFKGTEKDKLISAVQTAGNAVRVARFELDRAHRAEVEACQALEGFTAVDLEASRKMKLTPGATSGCQKIGKEGALDETGVHPQDIQLVMQQVGCSRATAVKALRDSGGDLINAST